MFDIGVNTMRGLEGGMESRAARPAAIAAGVSASIPAAMTVGGASGGVTVIVQNTFNGPVDVDEEWFARTQESAVRKGLVDA
jgi:hypothetical protein